MPLPIQPSDPVTRVMGVGQATAEILAQHNVRTVQQLADLPADSPVKVPKLKSLREHAQQAVQAFAAGVSQDTPADTQDSRERFLVSSHSWYEHKVWVPAVDGPDAWCQAAVYEMSIEPYCRVAFVCSWLQRDEKGTQEKLCRMTYSPFFLFHYNPGLPPFVLEMTEADFRRLPHQFAVENVLHELQLIMSVPHDPTLPPA